MAARVKIDEDLPTEVANLLRQAGHDVLTVFEQGIVGTPDAEFWPIVQQEQRCLLTADKGFANAVKYPPGSHGGIVLFRLPRESRSGYIRLAETLLARVALDTATGAIVVVTPDMVRIHRGEESRE